jgi:L-phenylalanine/L-methionine N-acetyltransferase
VTLRIRRARAEDAGPLEQYARTLFGERLPQIYLRDEPPTVEEQAQLIDELSSRPGCVLLLAEEDSMLIGMLGVRAYRAQSEHGGSLGMSVARDHRGRGVGGRLVAALCDWMDAQHALTRVEAEVFSNNEPARRLFSRHGFVLEGTLRRAVRVESELLDVWLLARLHPSLETRG